MREHDCIADWVINQLCDEFECDGDEIIERVQRLKHRAETFEKAYHSLGDEHFTLITRICKMQAEIKKILPDFNCRMFEPYHALLKSLLEEI